MGLEDGGLRDGLNVTTSIPASLTIDTLSATNVDSDTVTLRGEITEIEGLGDDATVRFDWGETGQGLPNTTADQLQGSTGVFTEDLSGLTAETEYEFRAEGEVRDVFDEGAIVTVTTASAIPDSVIHRYRFEGDGSDSVGSLDGTVEGGNGAFTGTNPIEGSQSFVGDGSDNRLELPSDINVDATVNGISFEFSVEFSSVKSDTGVFSLDDQNTAFYAFFSADGELAFGYATSDPNVAVFATGFQTGTLYDIICQYDASQSAIEIYVDGSLADSNSASAAFDTPRNNNNFGSQKDGSRWLSATRADDFRIHDSAIK